MWMQIFQEKEEMNDTGMEGVKRSPCLSKRAIRIQYASRGVHLDSNRNHFSFVNRTMVG
jgi:hypothetical protein